MRLIYLNEINSTQKYLIKKIKNLELKPPVCIWTDNQTDGIGSRGSRWEGGKGNLFFSFGYEKRCFDFIPVQSLSIYFGWIFKKTLNEFGSKVIMKWPNDIYLVNKEVKKLGGIITNLADKKIICGIGLNTSFAPSYDFTSLDIKIKNDKILQRFFFNLEKKEDWETVINEFEIEFKTYKNLFKTEGVLEKDGSLINKEKRIYSKR